MRFGLKMRQGWLAAAIALSVGIGGFLYCNSPDRRIRALFESGRVAIEREDLQSAMDHVSLQYRDDLGLSYLLVQRLLRMSFDEFEEFEIRYAITDLYFREDLAFVAAEVKVFAGFHGQRVYLAGSPDEESPVRITLGKDVLGWKVRSVDGLKTGFDGF